MHWEHGTVREEYRIEHGMQCFGEVPDEAFLKALHASSLLALLTWAGSWSGSVQAALTLHQFCDAVSVEARMPRQHWTHFELTCTALQERCQMRHVQMYSAGDPSTGAAFWSGCLRSAPAAARSTLYLESAHTALSR